MQDQATTTKNEKMSFRDQYNEKKRELGHLRTGICTLLDISEESFYRRLREDNWKMPEKRLIASWLKEDISVLFPKDS